MSLSDFDKGKRVRPATIADLEQCERLDGAFATEYVWQMEETVGAEAMGASFRRLRIPRRVTVPYPRPTDDLYSDWQRNECFLVMATTLGRIVGYLDMTVRHWQWQGWIEHLIVHPAHRQQGIATQLLQAAERWARGSTLRAITVAVQPKNDPAISLLLKEGFAFRGFIDHYFANGDVGLFYTLDL